jgi:hypothetical protein
MARLARYQGYGPNSARSDRNCWRIEHARRAKVIIDADDYLARGRDVEGA